MWSKKRLSLTESTRIRPKPSNPDAFRTTPARSPSKTARLRRILDPPRPDSQWSPQEPGRRKRSGRACARIGVGYGALGQATWRAFPHWGRQEGIGVGKLPTPMGGFLPQFLPPLPCRQRTPYPNGWFPVPMRFVGKRRRRGARSGGYTAWPPGARAREPPAMGCFHSDTDTTDPTFAAIPPLSQRYHTSQVL